MGWAWPVLSKRKCKGHGRAAWLGLCGRRYPDLLFAQALLDRRTERVLTLKAHRAVDHAAFAINHVDRRNPAHAVLGCDLIGLHQESVRELLLLHVSRSIPAFPAVQTEDRR